ncbi:hypothetical protein M3Y96_01197900 [Aphelenchoides besseyi]|nr:hypothetical protein M3Y96_01197900 [Aphelenchoides besseyi]
MIDHQEEYRSHYKTNDRYQKHAISSQDFTTDIVEKAYYCQQTANTAYVSTSPCVNRNLEANDFRSSTYLHAPSSWLAIKSEPQEHSLIDHSFYPNSSSCTPNSVINWNAYQPSNHRYLLSQPQYYGHYAPNNLKEIAKFERKRERNRLAQSKCRRRRLERIVELERLLRLERESSTRLIEKYARDLRQCKLLLERYKQARSIE